jgi:NAD(P)-dependent dehydrogenase (short-subunit alcohol dehydrogenase family)
MAPLNLGLAFPRPTKEYHNSAYPAISPSRDELSLKGKTVLITGGATGIGLETSKAFAQAGASIIAILARSKGPMMKAKEEIEADYPATKVIPLVASMTDAERISQVTKEIGTIDNLVLNAGIMHTPGSTLSVDSKEVLSVFETNVFGPLNVIRAFMALPPRTEGASRTIVHTSTAGVGFIMPGVAAYNASKSAMTYLMRALDSELREQGVRIFSFHPAIAFTDMARDTMGIGPDSFVYDTCTLHEKPEHNSYTDFF